ncbi:MAG: leucyl aminopeptidase [Deltaproteobacteria bacterium]|nr:leucyl aminopeptidase [Deltaproteobacteria bacterium]
MVAIGIVSPGRFSADQVAIGCFEGEAPLSSRWPEKYRVAVAQLTDRPGWKGKSGQVAETQTSEGRPQAIGLWGLGARHRFTGPLLNAWLEQVTSRAKANGSPRLAVVLPDHPETTGSEAAERVLRNLLLSEYRFDRFRSASKGEKRQLAKIEVIPTRGQDKLYRGAQQRAKVVARAVTLSRDLANAPANEATPIWMVEQALEKLHPLGFESLVMDLEELRKRGMEGIASVGQGSINPPRLLRLEWGTEGPVIALVGKGVTFDSGGLSLKPAASMVDMKYDKCGACSMIAVGQAVAELELPVRLRIYLPLAENMPAASAYRPGDILRCYNGKTVEVLNTDAEGRLLLADAMAFAVEEKPSALLEYSTLTGGAVVALGFHGAALFCPDDDFAGELEEAALKSGDRIWRMPMWPEYLQEMKGNHSDLRNSATRWGSPGTAAGFLSEFVGDLKRWAHLDIAGTAHKRSEASEDGGATGFGVSLAVEWLRRQVE